MSKIMTLEDFSKKAVENFVQTVVFVDDKIYTSPLQDTGNEKKKLNSPRRRKSAIKSVDNPLDVSAEPFKKFDTGPILSPQDIQDSFAEKSIVCSLHQPRKTDSLEVTSCIYKVCSAADIVIIDWDLDGDAGGAFPKSRNVFFLNADLFLQDTWINSWN